MTVLHLMWSPHCNSTCRAVADPITEQLGIDEETAGSGAMSAALGEVMSACICGALSSSLAHVQGIRAARQTDLAAIQELLAPLEQAGITKKRSRRDLSADLQHFTVVEREAKVRQRSTPNTGGPPTVNALHSCHACVRAFWC